MSNETPKSRRPISRTSSDNTVMGEETHPERRHSGESEISLASVESFVGIDESSTPQKTRRSAVSPDIAKSIESATLKDKILSSPEVVEFAFEHTIELVNQGFTTKDRLEEINKILSEAIENPNDKKFIKSLFSTFDKMLKDDPDFVFTQYSERKIPDISKILEYFPSEKHEKLRSSLEKRESASTSVTPIKKPTGKGLSI
jgi:hypothetical protein